MKCSSHPTVNAIGECVKCHVPVCTKCQVIWEETTYCDRCIDEILGTEARLGLQHKPIPREETQKEPEDVLEEVGAASGHTAVRKPFSTERLVNVNITREVALRTSNELGKVLSTAFGPCGGNAILGKEGGNYIVTKDGMTILNSLRFDDPEEDLILKVFRDFGKATVDEAGTGMTRTVILACAISKIAIEQVISGNHAEDIKRQLDIVSNSLAEVLRTLAKPLETKQELEHLITIATHDEAIGHLIAEVAEKAGKDGVMVVEQSKRLEYEVEYVDGIQFDQGYISPEFIADGDRAVVEIEDPYILITDQNISMIKDILPILEKILQFSKNMLIIAGDVDGEALATLVINKLRGTLNVVAVKAPGTEDMRKAFLEDIAILTGGKVISQDFRRDLETAALSDLGRARKVIVNKNETIIVEAKGSERDIKNCIKQLRAKVDKATSVEYKERLVARLSKLAGGVAVIMVGASTELQRKKAKTQFENALRVLKGAIDEGIVQGGCAPLVSVIKGIQRLDGVGMELLQEILLAMGNLPQILLSNAGHDPVPIIQELDEKSSLMALDSIYGKWVDSQEKGLWDSAKVWLVALQNAFSAAKLLVTTQIIVPKEEMAEAKMEEAKVKLKELLHLLGVELASIDEGKMIKGDLEEARTKLQELLAIFEVKIEPVQEGQGKPSIHR